MKKLNRSDKLTRFPVGEIILSIFVGVAIMSVATVAPGVLVALKRLGVDKKLLKRQKYYINDSLDRLVKRGFIKIREKNGKKFASLTDDGKKKLFKIQAKGLLSQINKKWDDKYRVIIFDIKESEKFVREEIRFTLLQCGFVKLQNSVWVYPYPCEAIVHLLRMYLEVNPEDLIYMVVDTIENDSWLRKHFDLPKK